MNPVAYRFLALVLVLVPGANAQAEVSGKAVYERQCSHCHAPGGDRPGTVQLAVTRGEDKALLTEREDLSAEYVKHVVRHGLRAMPPFYPSDLTDGELDALAAYLSK